MCFVKSHLCGGGDEDDGWEHSVRVVALVKPCAIGVGRVVLRVPGETVAVLVLGAWPVENGGVLSLEQHGPSGILTEKDGLAEHVSEGSVVGDNGDSMPMDEWMHHFDCVNNNKCLSLGGFVFNLVFLRLLLMHATMYSRGSSGSVCAQPTPMPLLLQSQ